MAVDLPAPAHAPDEVRRVVADVLSRAEYAEAAPSLAARARGWIGEQLGRLIEAVAGTGQASLVGSLVLVGVLLATLVLAVRFARGLQHDPAAPAVLADGVGRDPAEWEADADEHERAGRHREALRCRYRGLVAVLAAAGVVEETPGRTTGEYLAEVRARRPAAAADLAAVTAAFEAAWYGHAPVDQGTVDEVRRRSTAVHALAARASSASDERMAAVGDPR